MKVLITGISGFLGSHIVSNFAKENVEIVGLIRSKSNLYRYKNQFDPKIKLYNIDITPIDQIFEENKLDAIIHLATEYGRNAKVSEVLNANLIFPLNLLEMATKYKVKTFINTDSYFNKSDHFFYSSLPNYSLSKKNFITWLERLSDQVQIINVYLEHIYGPLDSEQKFVENLIQTMAIRREKSIRMTHGHQKRDFIFVSDVASAYLKILKFSQKSNFKIKNYQIGTGESIEIREFTNMVLKLSNSNTIPLFGEIAYRDYEIMDSKADLSHISELDWTPKVTPEIGIKMILDEYT